MLLGILLLAIWLIATGLLPLTKGRLPHSATVLNVLAVVAESSSCWGASRKWLPSSSTTRDTEGGASSAHVESWGACGGCKPHRSSPRF